MRTSAPSLSQGVVGVNNALSDRVLECCGFERRFGRLMGVTDARLYIARGEISGLAHPNGIGKTTPVDAITRFFPPQKDTILFGGRDITGTAPYKSAAFGVAPAFHNPALFNGMTVLGNIPFGRYNHTSQASFVRRCTGGWLAVRKLGRLSRPRSSLILCNCRTCVANSSTACR